MLSEYGSPQPVARVSSSSREGVSYPLMTWLAGSPSSQNLTCQLALLRLAQFVLQLADMTGTVLEGQCGPINLRLFWGVGGVTLQYTGIPVAGSDPWPAWLGSIIDGWYVCWGTAWEPWVIGTCVRHKQKSVWKDCVDVSREGYGVINITRVFELDVTGSQSCAYHLSVIFPWRKSLNLADCMNGGMSYNPLYYVHRYPGMQVACRP